MGAHDLAYAGMAEQLGMDRRSVAGRTMLGGPQLQDTHVGSLGGLLDNQPGLATLPCPEGAVRPALA